MTLKKRDLQLFFKRLRKLNKEKIKYYACGEYGGKTMRPHYHIILFNADQETIEKAWTLGHIHIGTCTIASVGYTLKYVSKDAKIPMHSRDDREPESSLMSKKMGDNYLTPQMIKYHKADLLNRMYCTIEDGKKIAMPRYYKDKIYSKWQRQRVGYHMQQQECAKLVNKTRDQQNEILKQNDKIRIHESQKHDQRHTKL